MENKHELRNKQGNSNEKGGNEDFICVKDIQSSLNKRKMNAPVKNAQSVIKHDEINYQLNHTKCLENKKNQSCDCEEKIANKKSVKKPNEDLFERTMKWKNRLNERKEESAKNRQAKEEQNLNDHLIPFKSPTIKKDVESKVGIFLDRNNHKLTKIHDRRKIIIEPNVGTTNGMKSHLNTKTYQTNNSKADSKGYEENMKKVDIFVMSHLTNSISKNPFDLKNSMEILSSTITDKRIGEFRRNLERAI